MNILNPKFKYVNAASTDLRKTFEAERKRLAAEKKEKSNVCKLATAAGKRGKGAT